MRVVPVTDADRLGLPLVKRLLEETENRQVTATGSLSAARSRTSWYIILGHVAGEVGRA